MKTLVIHPMDRTTDFLQAIYKDLDCTVIRSTRTSAGSLRKAIKEHDRIICLGHGTPDGLIRHTSPLSYLIDSSFVQLLRTKIDCIFVWCDADQFATKYGLKGFVTGMIISEVDEALLLGVSFDYKDIEQSNSKFASALKRAVSTTSDPKIIKELFLEQYVPETFVEHFNQKNIYLYG